ncbi:MAG: hypothetical protein JSW28_08230 [Thermoplasmata archaeon]|nr:MAG: hypothetical protein JSW28_08230 [Thermoplasmata archaeon]
MDFEGGFQEPKASRRDLEDAEVLTKSLEIDLNEAQKTGADLTEARQLLEEAKVHLTNQNVKDVRITVKKAKTAIADAKRYHRAELLIQHALPEVNSVIKMGADPSQAQANIDKAREALQGRMYGDVSELVRTAKREAKEAKRYHRAKLAIENCRPEIAAAKASGADVTEAEAYIAEAEIELNKKDYGVVAQLVKKAKSASKKLQKFQMVKELIDEVKPEIEHIKRFGVRTEDMEQLVLEAETALKVRQYAEVRSLVRKIKRRTKRAMERKGGDVLLATIKHMIHKTETQDLDASDIKYLLDRAEKALEETNHVEIEQVISEITTVAKRLNIPVGHLASDLFSRAKLVDLEKIDMVFSEAERKISAEMARARMVAMRDLMTSAKELGIAGEDFMELLRKAEDAFAAKDFDVIEEYKEAFEEKLEEAKLKHRTEVLSLRFVNAMGLVSQFKELGIDMEKAEELMSKAEKELRSQNFDSAEQSVAEAEALAKEMRRKHSTHMELASVKDVVTEAQSMGAEVEEANVLLSQAEAEMEAGNLEPAMDLITEARTLISGTVEVFIQDKFPKFRVQLPEGGMEADAWNKCIIEIANIGDIIAKNIDLDIRGNVEVKGLERIDRLKVGEKRLLEVGLKPKEVGQIDMEVLLAYQRAFDDTIYQLNVAKRIIADMTGSYVVEDAFLIHNNGVLITKVSRKLEEDIDEDIFGGMLTAVQEFIKDSFRQRDAAGIRRLDFGTHKLLIERSQHVFLTTILAGGEPRYLPLYMLEVLKEVESKYAHVLENWRGSFLELEGVDEIVQKLLDVTEEKGTEVEGFEEGVVSSTIKLIEDAQEAGAQVGSPEVFIEKLIGTMESDGFGAAWKYLEGISQEVETEKSAEAALEKIDAMKELMKAAGDMGLDDTEFRTILQDAQNAFDARNFGEIERQREALESKFDEARIARIVRTIADRIKQVMAVVSEFRGIGITVDKPEELLRLAEQELDAKDFDSATRDVDNAEKLTKVLRQKHEIQIQLDTVKKMLSEAQSLGVDVQEANNMVAQAESEITAENMNNALKMIKKARKLASDIARDFIEGKFPKLMVKLPEKGLEADTWNKCELGVSNIGDIVAKNIDIDLRGEVEVKGLERIPRLDPDEEKKMEIGVKPKVSGELSVDVIIGYQRAFDETVYQLDVPRKLIAETSGTFFIEEVFLIHNSGLLVAQASRKLEEDLDTDIFSGMLTAIQEFVRDSFKGAHETGLKRMDFGPNKVVIEHGTITYLTAILIGGEPRFLPLYMLEILREVEEKYGSVLADWDGTYSQLGGIEDIIAKLMLVTEEKGADVEGFEEATVVSTMKLIEEAKQAGVEMAGPEAFAREIIAMMEEHGFNMAWEYLEKMGQEAQTGATELRTRLKDMEDLKSAFMGEMDDHMIKDIGDSLEDYLAITDKVIDVVLQAREEQEIKPSMPIKKVAVKSQKEPVRDALEKLRAPFLSKVNAKELDIVAPGTEWDGLKLELTPERDIIHKAYKQQASKVEGLLRYQSPWKIKNSIEKTGEYTLGVEGYPVKITSEMLKFKISIPENIVEKEFDSGVIYIDKEMTEEIKAESLAEELITHIIGLRRECSINDEDYIETQIFVDDKLAEQLESWKQHIASKTHSYMVEFPFDNIFEEGVSGYYAVQREIDGQTAWIGIVVVELEE